MVPSILLLQKASTSSTSMISPTQTVVDSILPIVCLTKQRYVAKCGLYLSQFYYFHIILLQVANFAHLDSHQPANSKQKRVLAIRYENIPVDLPIAKNTLTKAIQCRSVGFNIVTKEFSSKRPKCSVIIIDDVLQGNVTHFTIYIHTLSTIQLTIKMQAYLLLSSNTIGFFYC